MTGTSSSSWQVLTSILQTKNPVWPDEMTLNAGSAIVVVVVIVVVVQVFFQTQTFLFQVC